MDPVHKHEAINLPDIMLLERRDNPVRFLKVPRREHTRPRQQPSRRFQYGGVKVEAERLCARHAPDQITEPRSDFDNAVRLARIDHINDLGLIRSAKIGAAHMPRIEPINQPQCAVYQARCARFDQIGETDLAGLLTKSVKICDHAAQVKSINVTL